MTQEEKAKAYDKALEMAKQIRNGNPSSGTAIVVCEQIFPELTESEDERITKVMLEHFKSKTKETWCGLSVANIIAYLEKQKELFKSGKGLYYYDGEKTTYYSHFTIEKNPYDFAMSQQEVKQKEQNGGIEECTDFTIYHPLKNGKGEYECIPYSFYGSLTSFSEDKDLVDFLRTCFYTKEECNEWIERQKEQKPISEVFGFKVGDAVRLKDGDGRKHIIKSIEEVEGIHGQNFYHVEFEDNSARDGIYPGEEYPNGYDTQMEKIKKEQKPVEGDNETEIQKAFREGKSAGRKEVFNYPEEYGLQKPAEWSEEDKKRIQRIYDFLWKNRKGDTDTIYQIEKDADWLKSLRPSWKPSEEQMKALKYAAYHMLPGEEYRDVLFSLFKDLKELM